MTAILVFIALGYFIYCWLSDEARKGSAPQHDMSEYYDCYSPDVKVRLFGKQSLTPKELESYEAEMNKIKELSVMIDNAIEECKKFE